MDTCDCVWTICSESHFCNFVIFDKDLLSNSIIVSASTKILSSKILIDELFASLCDKVPVGNHRYVKEHVSAVD